MDVWMQFCIIISLTIIHLMMATTTHFLIGLGCTVGSTLYLYNFSPFSQLTFTQIHFLNSQFYSNKLE